MADAKKTDEELEEGFDKDGNPIPPPVEGEGKSPKISSKDDDEDNPSDDDKEDKDDKEPDLGDDDIPVRKSTFQHIIARKNKQINKLRSKSDDDVDDDKDDDAEDEQDQNDAGDDMLTPEARRAVRKEAAKVIEPVVKTLASKADEDDLQELITSEPEAKKYEKRIRTYMAHPEYKGVPASVIFHHLAFSDAEGAGARRKKAADHEAGLGKGGGRSTRANDGNTSDLPTVEEMNEMTDEEFEALQQRARTGEFVKPAE